MGKSRVHPVVAHDRLRLAVGFDPHQNIVRHYDVVDLELDHTLKITPETSGQADSGQKDIETIERPVVTQDLQIQAGRILRNRENIARPNFYQAGFT